MSFYGNKFKKKNNESKKVINKYETDENFKKNVDSDIKIIKSELIKIIKEFNINKFTSILDFEGFSDGEEYLVRVLDMDVYDYANLNNLSARKDIEEIQDHFFKLINQISNKIKENKNIKVFKKIDLENGNDWDDHIFICIFKGE